MITFEVSAETSLMPEEIVQGMFNPENWTSFNGSGLVPGISGVQIVPKNETIEGTLFKVKNSDGSQHEEIITGYERDRSLTMKLHKFGFPLNCFADHFLEIWSFSRADQTTRFTRKFELHPKNLVGSVMLKMIAHFFENAVAEHSKTITSSNPAN